MSASCMAIALASPGPIQMGRTRSPPTSSRMTTGVLLERSRPRLWTLTSTSTRRLRTAGTVGRTPYSTPQPKPGSPAGGRASESQGAPQLVGAVGPLPGEEPRLPAGSVHALRLAAEVSVRRGRREDGVAEAERV